MEEEVVWTFSFSFESYSFLDIQLESYSFQVDWIPVDPQFFRDFLAKEMAIARPLEGHCAQIDCNHR